MKLLFYRPTQVAVGLFFVLIASAIGIQTLLNARGQIHLEEIRTTLKNVAETQRVGLNLMRMLSYDLSEEWPLDVVELEGVTADLATAVSTFAGHRSSPNIGKLEAAVETLRRPASDRRAATAASLYLIREALHGETSIVASVLGEVETSMQTEARLGGIALLLLSVLVASVLALLYLRVFRPLDILKGLLLASGRGKFETVEVARIDPLVRPLFQNYNEMVLRMSGLERVQRQHAGSLEEQVRSATHALLQQQRSLARAERLAAVGELAAQVAHELRNPLAGMHMALMNLRQETENAEMRERLDLVIAELQRITRLLNDLVSRSRNTQEPKRRVQVAKIIQDLVQLVRYQVPAEIDLDAETPVALDCDLPADGLRQAILNLVLNSVHALGQNAGAIVVSCQRKDNKLIITVRDDGPGFPRSVLNGDIRSFVTENESGTGLGLTIVRRYAYDLEGELRLSNAKPNGARAELILPCKESARGTAQIPDGRH